MTTLLKDVLAVALGSGAGGAARYLVARAAQGAGWQAWPVGTFAVNVAGCFLIGFLATFHPAGGWPSPRLRLLLTTGFCGGFTTFSTFVGENAALWREGHYALLSAYVLGSLTLGWLALLAGHAVARSLET